MCKHIFIQYIYSVGWAPLRGVGGIGPLHRLFDTIGLQYVYKFECEQVGMGISMPGSPWPTSMSDTNQHSSKFRIDRNIILVKIIWLHDYLLMSGLTNMG